MDRRKIDESRIEQMTFRGVSEIEQTATASFGREQLTTDFTNTGT